MAIYFNGRHNLIQFNQLIIDKILWKKKPRQLTELEEATRQKLEALDKLNKLLQEAGMGVPRDPKLMPGIIKANEEYEKKASREFELEDKIRESEYEERMKKRELPKK